MCKHCETNSHVYANCLGCSARLVLSARPRRKNQEAMLNYLTIYGKFSRDEILAEVKRCS